jgi:hypothetical protein
MRAKAVPPTPSVVIFSSRLGLSVANRLVDILKADAKCHVWEEVMQPSHATIEDLTQTLAIHDFAICVITGDREVPGEPGNLGSSENVLFEAGLSFGTLGRERTFLFRSEDQRPTSPYDLQGINTVPFKEGGDLREACRPITTTIRIKGRRIPEPTIFRKATEAFSSISRRLSEGLNVDRAELIQHSSERVYDLINELMKRQAAVDLYVQDPDVVEDLSRLPRGRVLDRIKQYEHDVHDLNYQKGLRIFFYKTPASFSGVSIKLQDGRTIFLLSWYTYTSFSNLPVPLAPNAAKIKLTGGENVCIEVDDRCPESRAISDLFQTLTTSCQRQSPQPAFECIGGIVIRRPAS